MNKIVSIIMPAYNSEKFIGFSIESVLKQTLKNWELIIINDGSTDNTKKIIEEFKKKDERIKVINLPMNKGIANARNVGIEKAKGKYISFLDSDDCWNIEKLTKQIKYMEINSLNFTFTDYNIMDEYGKVTGSKINSKVSKVNYKELLKTNRIGCLTVVVNAEIIKGSKFKQIKHEDYDLWLTILKENTEFAYHISECLSYYRKSSDSVSSNKVKSILWVWNIYRKGQNFSFLKSLNLFIKYVINKFLK